jgi:regulator of protease activity HflC (stomatin/prohibitin superfamily)
MNFFVSLFIGFFTCLIGFPIALAIFRSLGFYVVIDERRSKVFTLFGEVIGTIDEPGLHLLWGKLGIKSALIPLFGKVLTVDLRLDQEYLRSQPVNSEEGAPMGIGIWYEMWPDNASSFLFKNADPRGSLRANVSNAAVRTLSNMKLGDMLETRHVMSQAVRNEVTPRSAEWGYQVGSVYIRKVHFRDTQMIHQIEEKVVNRLRQVTSAIRQDGANQVSIIKSSADRQAAAEFARASTQRPQIVGEALRKISEDPHVMESMFELLETQKLLESNAPVTLLPAGNSNASQLLVPLLAAHNPK